MLADIIRSGVVPVVELTEIFRQSAESEIICNAHLINRGEIPSLESSKDRLSDFYFIHQNDAEKAAELIVDLVRNHIPGASTSIRWTTSRCSRPCTRALWALAA